MLGASTHIDLAHIRLELLNGLVQSCGKLVAMYMIRILVKLVLGIQVAMCMTRILVKLVLGIHVFLAFTWGGRLAYKSKD